ncbi:MAG: hypothetical protein ACJ790_06620 [Myxococcaceae bacterium]
MAVVVVAALVFLPIIAWRSIQAMKAAHASSDPDRLVTEEVTKKPPAWFKSPGLTRMETEPTCPHVRLGTLHYTTSAEHAKKLLASPTDLTPTIWKHGCAMGGDTIVFEKIDENVPGTRAGDAELVAAVYLTHAGVLPAEWRSEVGRELCEVTEVFPNAAEPSSFRTGDLFLEINGANVAATSNEQRGCDLFEQAIDRVPLGSPANVRVLRNGQPVSFTMAHKGHEFAYVNVPVLDDF